MTIVTMTKMPDLQNTHSLPEVLRPPSSLEPPVSLLLEGVIEALLQESKVLPWLSMQPFDSRDFNIGVYDRLPEVKFRHVNQPYDVDYITFAKRHSYGVTPLGRELTLEKSFLSSSDSVREKVERLVRRAKLSATIFDKMFFRGKSPKNSNDPPGFDGLNELAAQGIGQEISLGTNGAQLILDHIEEAIRAMRHLNPSVWLMNERMAQHLWNLENNIGGQFPLAPLVLKTQNGTLELRQYGYYSSYTNAHVVIVGDDFDGNEILGFNEVQGASTDCTSIYGVHFSSLLGVRGILSEGGSLMVLDSDDLLRMEFYPGIAVSDLHSFVRIKGIRKPSE